MSEIMDYLESIQQSIRYIEDNLINDITLDALAHQAHFSPFHYHRLFQSAAGEPVMEYVRRKRLLKASGDLLATGSSVADTAYKYRFNSQDVFTRAFKRQFGVTPAAWKKLNQQLNPASGGNKEKEDSIMLDPYIGQKIQCTHIEKKECILTLERILELSEKARKHGLFTLESEIKSSDSIFLRKALQLIIDGIEPNCIRTILTNYITVGDFKGRSLLERILITEGILSIQAGENPLIIREKLYSFFGEDFITEIEKYYGSDMENQLEKIRSYCTNIRETTPMSSLTALLEEPVQNLSGRSLQRLLREVEPIIVARAIKGSSGEIQARILENLSKPVAVMVIDELIKIKTIEPTEIVQHQGHIMNTLDKLKADGDIL